MRILIIFIALTLSGCSALKERAGDYVSEALIQNIEHRVDGLLSKRGLSVSEIKEILDSDQNQSIDKKELVDVAKETTKDVVMLEARRLVEAQIAENTQKLASASDLEKQKYELWNWLLGLVAAYLGKQIYSAKQDNKRDQKIALVEKLLNKDIDEDGKVG